MCLFECKCESNRKVDALRSAVKFLAELRQAPPVDQGTTLSRIKAASRSLHKKKFSMQRCSITPPEELWRGQRRSRNCQMAA